MGGRGSWAQSVWECLCPMWLLTKVPTAEGWYNGGHSDMFCECQPTPSCRLQFFIIETIINEARQGPNSMDFPSLRLIWPLPQLNVPLVCSKDQCWDIDMAPFYSWPPAADWLHWTKSLIILCEIDACPRLGFAFSACKPSANNTICGHKNALFTITMS